jgi:cobalamin biosynthesis Mg chelatase CobN
MRSSLRWTIPTFLALQMGLLWIQGAQLHRQSLVLQGLREDIQSLTETMESSQSAISNDEGGGAVPARFRHQAQPSQQVAVLGVEQEQEATAKDLKASRDSAQKAVKEAREVQSKLSIEENIRKAEEAKKVQTATDSWQKWVWGAIALVVVALVVRSVLQRRS